MNPYILVVLTKYPDICGNLLESVGKYDPDTEIVIVSDGCEIYHPTAGVINAPQGDGFNFSRNANLAISSAPDHDIILCNDDVILREPKSLQRLAEAGDKRPTVGILSPLIDGGVGNPYQSVYKLSEWPSWSTKILSIAGSIPICFVCVWLKRKMLNEIGLLDEGFVGYGLEDNDLCLRARAHGWITGIFREVTVQHGAGGGQLSEGLNWSSSFIRSGKPRTSVDYFNRKHPQHRIG